MLKIYNYIMEKQTHSEICRNCIVKIKRIPLPSSMSAKFQANCLNKEINHQNKKYTIEALQFKPVQYSTPLVSNSDENVKSNQNRQPLSQKKLLVGDSHSTINYLNNQSLNTLKEKAENLPMQKENIKPKKSTVKLTKHKNSGVYEFSSKITADTKNVDPAEDIIKKLIRNGKVKVATNYKRKVRPNVRCAKAQKTSASKCTDKIGPPHLETNINRVEVKSCTPKNLTNVLKKQSKHSDLQNKRAKQLLHIVRKIVSTRPEECTPTNNFLDSSMSRIAATAPLHSDKTNGRGVKALCSSIENRKISDNNNLQFHSVKEINANEENLPPTNTSYNNNTPCKVQNGKSSRTPLKAINILEVINLPPWREESKIEQNSKKEKNEYAITQKAPPHYTEDCINLTSPNESTLFGFEEYLKDCTLDDSSRNHKVYEVTQKNEKSLHEKLKELSKWRPKVVNKNLHISKMAHANKKMNRLQYAANINRNNIKDILCSTMIREKPTKEMYSNNSDESQCSKPKMSGRDSNNLFADTGFQKHLIKGQKHFRTYDKPNKNNYCNSTNIIKKGFENVNNKLQTANNIENMQKEKYTEHQENPELEKFVNDFKKACEEVEQYELIIEKSDT